jgi:hypothetical protein
MHEVLSSLESHQVIEIEEIATAMLSSASPQELLKIFLITVGKHLAVNRVVIYQFINQRKGKVLVEAISPNCQSIKNQIYTINYFGIDSRKNYPSDRTVVLSDVSQVTETLAIHQQWQDTGVKAMMSSAVLLDVSTNNIWGLAVVQQCDRVRLWRSPEADFLLKISQILGQCLQYWQIRLQPPPFSNLFGLDQYIHGDINSDAIDSDREEFIAIRTELPQDLERISIQSELSVEEIAVSSDFVPSEEEENEVLSRGCNNGQNSINHAINLAMQKLDWERNPVDYLNDCVEIDDCQGFDDVDVESSTLEDILEAVDQSQNQDKIEYLQQRVQELTESLQQKLDEVETLQTHIQDLMKSQKKFRQILLDLQSENLSQTIKETVIKTYRSLDI